MRRTVLHLLFICSTLFAAQAQATTYNMGALFTGNNMMGGGLASQGQFTEGVIFGVEPPLVPTPSYVTFSITSPPGITDDHIAIYQVLGGGKTKLVAAGSDETAFLAAPGSYDVIFTGIGAKPQNPFAVHAFVSSVPEPGSYALYMAGLAVLAVTISRKKHGSRMGSNRI